MSVVLIGAGAVCLLYFCVLMIKRVDFGVIWLPVSGLFLAAGGYREYRILHPDGFRIPGVILMGAGLVLAVVLALFLVVEGRIIAGMFQKPEAGLSYVIVLGAQVKGREPSKALRLRLQKAETYLKENPDTKVVLSGGRGDGEEISEAECMYRYLTKAGIDKERILLEDRSTTTLENLRFSARVITEDGKSSAFQRRIGILSNNFHVYRAGLLGEHMGYENVSLIAADSDWQLQIHYLVREFFALFNEKIRGNI